MKTSSATPKKTMIEDPGNLKPQRPKHYLARAIGVALVISTGFAVCELIGIDPTKSFWPFMVVVGGGSWIGNVIGVFLAQRIGSK